MLHFIGLLALLGLSFLAIAALLPSPALRARLGTAAFLTGTGWFALVATASVLLRLEGVFGDAWLHVALFALVLGGIPWLMGFAVRLILAAGRPDHTSRVSSESGLRAATLKRPS